MKSCLLDKDYFQNIHNLSMEEIIINFKELSIKFIKEKDQKKEHEVVRDLLPIYIHSIGFNKSMQIFYDVCDQKILLFKKIRIKQYTKELKFLYEKYLATKRSLKNSHSSLSKYNDIKIDVFISLLNLYQKLEENNANFQDIQDTSSISKIKKDLNKIFILTKPFSDFHKKEIIKETIEIYFKTSSLNKKDIEKQIFNLIYNN